ncbi:MAG: hypothetical protein KAR11_08035 [Phycisphaerae bacterium]|nr:hypothetical protein [Phycisphaerae bacterium]
MTPKPHTSISAAPVFDIHTHTQFAYCAQDVTAEAVIAKSREKNLAGVAITEHSPQLYCLRDDFWCAKHLFDQKLWRSPLHSRMPEFRREIFPLRSEFVSIGFEVEVDSCGDLVILDEDRADAEFLIGAVHWVNCDTTGLTPAAETLAFMKTCEQLLAGGVDILAHPWRYFGRAKLPVPKELYTELADMLAATGTAAEINYHTNAPDPEFFAMCIDRGVKIAIGSDSHNMSEAGEFGGHLETLALAADGKDISPLIFTPPQKLL